MVERMNLRFYFLQHKLRTTPSLGSEEQTVKKQFVYENLFLVDLVILIQGLKCWWGEDQGAVTM